MDYEIKVKELPAQQLATMRTIITPEQISAAVGGGFERIFAYLPACGAMCVGAPLVIYHRFDEEVVDLEVGVPVAGPIAEGEGVTAGSLPAGAVACTTHVGSYDGVGAAHEAVDAWIREHGHEVGDPPCWEVYLTSPDEEPDPAKYVTEVCYSIR